MRLLPEEHHREAHAEDQSRENKEMFTPSMPQTFPSLSSQHEYELSTCSRGDLDGGHSARVKERLGDEDCETKKQSSNNRHFGHVGIA